jgi:4'-phosphopantetheinyl transferase EntD
MTDIDRSDEEIALQAALVHAAATLPGKIAIGCRQIRPADAAALTPAEAAPLVKAVPAVRAASGAGRLLARQILQSAGVTPVALLRSPSGAPAWPEGYVGSIAHDDVMAVAAIARDPALRGIGIDVEPRASLPEELVDLVVTAPEARELDGDRIAARLLFCAKEAVYKATNPIDGRFLEFDDIAVGIAAGMATTKSGWRLKLALGQQPRLFAVAVLERG